MPIMPYIIVPILTLGVVVTLVALGNTFMDLCALRSLGVNGARRLVAMQGVRHVSVRLAIHALLILAIYWSVKHPPVAVDVRLIFFRNAVIVSVSVLLSIDSIWDFVDVRRLKAKYPYPKRSC